MRPTTDKAKELSIDEYMAEVGVDMLHAGGTQRTDELASMCKISKDKTVLDEGCGYGKTACYLAKKHRCKLVGIDLSEKMIYGARKKMKKEGLGDLVHFQVGNAENLLFEDESFDVVISEGTTVLVNKKKAVNEYMRITKSGGCIGLNELSWTKKPSKELVEKTYTELQGMKPLENKEWIKLLADSGLENIKKASYKYNSFSFDVIRSIGFRPLVKVCRVYISNSRIRRWINRQESVFRDYSEYWSYSLCAGQKKTWGPVN